MKRNHNFEFQRNHPTKTEKSEKGDLGYLEEGLDTEFGHRRLVESRGVDD